MISKVIVNKNSYYDSVTLMSLSGKVLSQEGVREAVVSMGTQMNKELLHNVGLMTEEAQKAQEGDMIIAVESDTQENLEKVISFIENELNAKKAGNSSTGNQPVKTFNSAFESLPQANLAVISVPGEYAAREAKLALEKGLHVMIFSDNVSIEDERFLKELGRDKGLLVMGPDCGTAILNHGGLCFANKVEEGSIGLVAASGTGLQEVTVQIDRLGEGISQAIGTGGRDLHEEIGGIMMIEGLKALDEDEQTKVIVLISKPPAESVQNKILEEVKKVTKPVVVCFLDGDKKEMEKKGIDFAPTLIEAARKSVQLLGKNISTSSEWDKETLEWISSQIELLTEEQKFIRGLFCGGTLTSEALSILRSMGVSVKSNVAKRKEEKLSNLKESDINTLLDMGEDFFTQGKPHPMIEPSLRNKRILKEAEDPETAVLLLDFELGYGSHIDPVGESYDTLLSAQQIAKETGRHLPIVAYLCGTKKDKQGYEIQEKKLKELGVCVVDSNEKASEVAFKIAHREVKIQ